MSRQNSLTITHQAITTLSEEARQNRRLRKNLNLHAQLDDPVQRMVNAMEPGTYVRPHRHARDNGWELMMCLKGSFSILIFDDVGRVLERIDLNADTGVCAVEIPAYSWHAVVSHQPGTVMFEVKPGPYSPIDDKDFAGWAPAENQPECSQTMGWYAVARNGDIPPIWTS
jgi:cupin fold WbuC family metalloprotein